MTIKALEPADRRVYTANVAGPAALLVAKLHKIGGRQGTPGRLIDKDAHDIYRLLVAIPTDTIAGGLRRLLGDSPASAVTQRALGFLEELFAARAEAPGSIMAGRAEQGIGDPPSVSAATALLAQDALRALRSAG